MLAAQGSSVAARDSGADLPLNIAPKATQLIRTPPPLMARLHKLHRAAVQLADPAPDILAHPEVARAIEQELLRALIACPAGSATSMKPNRNRLRIMERFHQLALIAI
jgi:hypothetical protein